RRRLGARVRQRRPVPAGARHQHAPQDRARSVAADVRDHRAGRRLPPRARALMPIRVLRLRGPRAWVVWGATLAAVSTLLVHYRALLGQRQAPVTLVFLLIILFGSVSGGRALGLTL